MIDNKTLDTIFDVIKAMKCDRYILMNGYIVGAKVQKNKGQYDVIESISYCQIGITVERMHSFGDAQIRDFMKSDPCNKYNMFDNVFSAIFDDPTMSTGNLQLLNTFNNVLTYLNRQPVIEVDNLKDNEEFMNAYSATSKYGLKFININGYIIPAYKAIASSVKSDTISLKVYKDIMYEYQGYISMNNNALCIIADYIVNKKKYTIHNLYRMIPICK